MIAPLVMTVFFFFVGLEIKREVLIVDRSGPKKAALPSAVGLTRVRPLPVRCG